MRKKTNKTILFLSVLALSTVLWTAPAQATTCNGLTVTISGTAGNDVISGTSGNDVIHGLGGNDPLAGIEVVHLDGRPWRPLADGTSNTDPKTGCRLKLQAKLEGLTTVEIDPPFDGYESIPANTQTVRPSAQVGDSNLPSWVCAHGHSRDLLLTHAFELLSPNPSPHTTTGRAPRARR